MKLDVNCDTELVNRTIDSVSCNSTITHDYVFFQIFVAVTSVLVLSYGLLKATIYFKKWYYEEL